MKDLTIEEIVEFLKVDKPKEYNYVVFDIKKYKSKIAKLKERERVLLSEWEDKIDKRIENLDRIDSKWRVKIAINITKNER